MSGNTANRGYPYPLTADFSDVQDAFRLATAVDADLRNQQAPFRSFLSRPSFVVRQLAAGSTYISGTGPLQMTVIEWDNTGGVTLNGYYFNQPLNEGPSWWLFGTTIQVFNAATGVVGDLVMGSIEGTSTDQVTGQSSNFAYYQRNDESGAGGEWVNLFAMVPMYQGIASANLTLNGTTLKAIGAGSHFWGMYLGPVT